MMGLTTVEIDSAPMADEILANRAGSTVRVPVSQFAAQIAAEVPGPQYETRAALYGDLNWAADTRGTVWGDATVGYRGLYKKSGASGAGAWARFADLPLTTLGEVTTQQIDAMSAAVGVSANKLGSLPATVNATVSGNGWVLAQSYPQNMRIEAVTIRSAIAGSFAVTMVRGEVGENAVPVGEPILLTSDGSGLQSFIVDHVLPAGCRLRLAGSGVLQYNSADATVQYLTVTPTGAGLASGPISGPIAARIACQITLSDKVRAAGAMGERSAADRDELGPRRINWIGVESAGLGAASSGMYLINQILPFAGLIARLRAFITGSVGRSISIAVYRPNAAMTEATLVSTHTATSSAAGWVDLTLDSPIKVAAGDMLAVNGAGYLGLSGAAAATGAGFRPFTAGAAAAVGQTVAIGAGSASVFAVTAYLTKSAQYAGDVIGGSPRDAQAALEFFGSGGAPQRVGYYTDTDAAIGAGSKVALSDACWIFSRPAARDTLMSKLVLDAAISGVVTVRVFAPAAAGSYIARDHDVAVSAGLNVITDLPSIVVPAGSYLGIIAPGIGRYVATPAAGIADTYTAASRAAQSFVPPGAWSSQTILVGFELSLSVARVLHALDDKSAVSQDTDLGSIFDGATAVCTAAAGTITILASARVVQSGDPGNTYSGTLTVASPANGMVRYDLVSLNRVTGALVLTAGTERATDPHAFLPSSPANCTGIMTIRHTMSAGGVYTYSMVSVGDVIDGEIYSLRPMLAAARARNARCLVKLIRKIRAGQAIRILGMGDSITAMEHPTGGAGATNLNVARDQALAGYFVGGQRYGDDVRATIQTYTRAQLGRGADGLGATYTRVGAIWEMVAKLEADWGYTLGTNLFYDNLSKGGWRTGEAIDGSGNPTSWMTTALGVAADVVIIALGMNERGDVTTEARLTTMVQLFRAAGRDVLLVPCMRPRTGGDAPWLLTNRIIEAVALRENVAMVPLDAVMTGDRLRVSGLTLDDVCAASTTNHPGLEELRMYGRELYRALGL